MGCSWESMRTASGLSSAWTRKSALAPSQVTIQVCWKASRVTGVPLRDQVVPVLTSVHLPDSMR